MLYIVTHNILQGNVTKHLLLFFRVCDNIIQQHIKQRLFIYNTTPKSISFFIIPFIHIASVS